MLIGLPGQKGVGKLQSAAGGRSIVLIFDSIHRSEDHRVGCRRYCARLSQSRYTRLVSRRRAHDVKPFSYFLLHENGLVTYEVRFTNRHGQLRCGADVLMWLDKAQTWSLAETLDGEGLVELHTGSIPAIGVSTICSMTGATVAAAAQPAN